MKRWIFGIAMMLFGLVSFGQNYKLAESKLSVTGTSTLHDWECVVEKAQGNMTANLQGGKVTEIKNFEFSFPVKSLKSGKGAMDKKVYDALKEKKNKQIKFSFNKLLSIKGDVARVEGMMDIAGVKKAMVVEGKMSADGKGFVVKGEKAFKMTDFNMEPPVAMFGTITTGDDIVIHYELHMAI